MNPPPPSLWLILANSEPAEGFNLVRSIILTALGATLLGLALHRLRRYKLKERYALLFGVSGLPFLVLAFWPGAILHLGRLLHMEYFTVMLLCVSVFLILMLFELLTIVSQQDQRISTLAQMVGILMEKQKELDPNTPRIDPLNAPESPAAELGESPPSARPAVEVQINPVTPRRIRDLTRTPE